MKNMPPRPTSAWRTDNEEHASETDDNLTRWALCPLQLVGWEPSECGQDSDCLSFEALIVARCLAAIGGFQNLSPLTAVGAMPAAIGGSVLGTPV